MIWPSPRTLLTVLLLVTLSLFCASELVQAAAPSPASMECANLLCDATTGCGTTPPKYAASLVATLVVAPLLGPPSELVTPMAATVPSTPRDRQVLAPAPRSPPAQVV